MPFPRCRAALLALFLLLPLPAADPPAEPLLDVAITVAAVPTGPVNRRIFGGVYNDLRGHAADWSYMGLTTCREFTPACTSPAKLEPQPGTWKWDDFDRNLDWLTANHTTGIVLLSYGADWMMKGGRDKPTDWEFFVTSWSAYAASVVRHTNIERKQRIGYWEIWNEPDGPFWFHGGWGGDSQRYSELFNAAARAMKQVDPTIQIGSGGMANPWGGTLKTWWEPCLHDGNIGPNLDFVAMHCYYGDPLNNQVQETIDRSRKLMHKYLGHEIPIWITEFNADFRADFRSKGTTFAQQSLYVAETLAVFAANDVAAAQYFCIGWFGSDFCPWDGPQGGDGRRPVVEAFHFWTDFRGDRLPVTVTGAGHLDAVACRDAETTTVYVPTDHAGTYRVILPQVLGKGVAATAFGDGVVRDLTVMSHGSEIQFDWPVGSRALVKLRVPQPP